MNLTRSMTMFQRLGLACLSAALAMPSSTLTSSIGRITSVNPSSLDADRPIGVNRQIDHGEAENVEHRWPLELGRQQDATPTPEPAATVQPSQGSIDPSNLESISDAATGSVIRRRVFSALAAGAVIAACLLLLLWAYVTLRDPFRRHRASVRMRQMRRDERRNRRRKG
jgi:hypothetical protein